MKTTTLFAAALSGMLLFLSVPSETKGQSVNVNFSVFYNELGRYGTWVNSPRYGQVWIYREPGFRPYYSRGRWNTPMRAGPGFRIMNGDGLLSTMADGNMMIIMADGSGYPIMNGHLPGSAGVKAAITMDGHPWDLA